MRKLGELLPEIGQLMAANNDAFVSHVGDHLLEVADAHTNYAAACPAGHMVDDVPCDEFEQALSLGISWLLGHRPTLDDTITASDMPDACHDVCGKNGHYGIVHPHRWVDGTAFYEDVAGHSWWCGWGHQASGEAPENRGREIVPGIEMDAPVRIHIVRTTTADDTTGDDNQ